MFSETVNSSYPRGQKKFFLKNGHDSFITVELNTEEYGQQKLVSRCLYIFLWKVSAYTFFLLHFYINLVPNLTQD